jgi:hypothetical protein
MTLENANAILDNAADTENCRVFDVAVALAIRHLQARIDDLHRHVYSQETACPMCGSTRIEAIDWYGGTGVTSPDGGEEHRLGRGFKCLQCGALEED